jgi:hypothetical protein
LSSRQLTFLLMLMCLTPIVIITLIFNTLGDVKLNQLPARIELIGGVPDSYYDLPFEQRTYLPEMQVAVTNIGSDPWTNLYVRINHHYSIIETGAPFRPGETREYLVNRFTSKTGAYFDMRYVSVKDVMVYARMPDKSRATYERRFDRPE